ARRQLSTALVDAGGIGHRRSRQGLRDRGRRRAMTRAQLFRWIVVAAGVALLVQSVRSVGLDAVAQGVRRVGWGFALILALPGAREAVRAFAWTRTIDGPSALRFLPALRARLAGEALNTLLPMGIVLGEPAKASQVASVIPFAVAMKGLVIEFAFY